MDITTDNGKKYKFSERDFRGFGKADDKSELDMFEYVKSVFLEDKVFYKHTDVLHALIEDKEYSEAEKTQVYELFDMN